MGIHKMKIFTNTDFTGFWPVGTAAVVIAANKKMAVQMLNIKLQLIGLVGDATEEGTYEIGTRTPDVCILHDGNY